MLSSHASPLRCFAAGDEDHIGFFCFMVGRVATKWISIQEIQETYYHSMAAPILQPFWMSHLCCQLILISHAMWMLHNQHIIQVWWQQDLASTLVDIRIQFSLGTQHLLLVDQFYVTLGTNGFTLQQVLDLPTDNQLLWLHAKIEPKFKAMSSTNSLLLAPNLYVLYMWKSK